MTENEIVDTLCGVCEAVIVDKLFVPKFKELHDEGIISDDVYDGYIDKAADVFADGMSCFLTDAAFAFFIDDNEDVPTKKRLYSLLEARNEEVAQKAIKDVFGSEEEFSKYFSEEELKTWEIPEK